MKTFRLTLSPQDMPVDPISFDDTLQLDIFGRAESPPVDRKLTVPLDQRLGQPEDSAEDSSSGLQVKAYLPHLRASHMVLYSPLMPPLLAGLHAQRRPEPLPGIQESTQPQ
jgi:hypothetical protein